jgi:hypothetical protein
MAAIYISYLITLKSQCNRCIRLYRTRKYRLSSAQYEAQRLVSASNTLQPHISGYIFNARHLEVY